MISPGAITRTEIQGDATASPSMWNVECWPRGTLSKRGGLSTKHLSARETPVVKMFAWTDQTETHHTMLFESRATSAASGANVFSVTITGGVAQFSQILTAGNYKWDAASGVDVIGCTTYAGSAIFVNGGSTFIMKWNGTTSDTAVSATTSPTGATCCVGWGGYLFLGNVPDGSVRQHSRVQWCSVNDITTWPSTYYIDLDRDDGDKITAMTLYGDYIVVFKENKVFTVSWVGGPLLFDAVRRSAEIGCVAGETLVQKNGLLYFLSKHGYFTFDGQNVKSVSDKVVDLLTERLNPIARKISKAVVFDPHEQIFLAVPTKASDTLDRVYVMDFTTGGWTAYAMAVEAFDKVTLSENMIYASYPDPYSSYETTIGEATGDEDEFLAIVSNGFVSEFGEVNTDQGVAIDAGWRSPWFDFGQAALNKRVLRISALVNTTSDSKTLNVDTYRDWDEETIRWSDSLELSATIALVREKRADFTESCRAFQFTVRASSSAPAWSVHRFELDYLPKGRTLVG